MSFKGEAGAYSLSGGINPPTLGAGRNVGRYTPPLTFQPSSDKFVVGVEMLDGSSALYGTPLTHAAQQMEARAYGASQIGFGDESVTFECQWAYMPPTMFTVSDEGWVQGA